MIKNWYITDMDGTFLTSSNELYPTATTVIQQMKVENIPFYIATGRLDLMIKPYYYQLDLDVPVISCNGALIRNLSTNEIIDSIHFTTKEIQIIIHTLQQAQLDFHIYTTKGVYGQQYTGRIAFLDQFEQQYSPELRTPVFVVDDILQVLNDDNLALKVLIIEENRQKSQQVYNELSQHLEIEGTFSASNLFDIMKKGVSKGAALKKLANYYHYQLANCVAFGDNDNDLPMLQLAGTAIVPNNAHDNIKVIADEIIESNNDGGVVKYLQKIISNK